MEDVMKKIIKASIAKFKVLFLIILAVFSLTLTSCEYREDGLESFNKAHSYGVTCYLIPDNFMEDFEYVDGDYHWYSDDDYRKSMDKTLLYLEYSDENYRQAKEFVLTEMDLDFSTEKSYNGYVFYINLAYANGAYREIFPRQYTMVGYNDNNSRIIFIGMCCAANDYPETQYGLTDFGLYLKTFFGEWYNFDDGLE